MTLTVNVQEIVTVSLTHFLSLALAAVDIGFPIVNFTILQIKIKTILQIKITFFHINFFFCKSL